MEALCVRDLMTEKVFTLHPDDKLLKVYDLMDAKHIRHIPVVDDEGNLVGLVTHRDLLRGALTGLSELPFDMQRAVLGLRTIETIMMTEVETIEPDQNIREAAQIMFENKYGCLPVVEGSRLLGILTEADFVRHLAQESAGEKTESKKIASERPPVPLRHQGRRQQSGKRERARYPGIG